MADPVSLMAVAGLVFAGRNLSKKKEVTPPPPSTAPPPPPPVNGEDPNFIQDLSLIHICRCRRRG